MNDFSKLLKLFSEIEPTGSPAVLTEGREQGAKDQSRRAFKRGEAAYDMDAEKWFKVKEDGKMYQTMIFPTQHKAAIAQGFSPTREEAQAKAATSSTTSADQPVTEDLVTEGVLDELKQLYQSLVSKVRAIPDFKKYYDSAKTKQTEVVDAIKTSSNKEELKQKIAQIAGSIQVTEANGMSDSDRREQEYQAKLSTVIPAVKSGALAAVGLWEIWAAQVMGIYSNAASAFGASAAGDAALSIGNRIATGVTLGVMGQLGCLGLAIYLAMVASKRYSAKKAVDSRNQGMPESMTEGAVKELDQDLTDMSDEEFKAEYKMTKAQAKAEAKDDAPVAESAEVVDEVAAPGQEAWIKSNKERFIKKYGKAKGVRVLYATAWKHHHADKANESLEECWGQAMSEPAAESAEQDSGMTINSSLDTKTGSKNLTVSARGHAAEQLAQILKLAGMESRSPEPMEVEVEMDEEYANEAAPEVQSIEVITAQGNDLNRQKTQRKPGSTPGNNPLDESAAIASIEKRLMEELDSIKTVNESKFTDAVYDYAMDAAQNRVNGWPRRMKSPGQTAYMLGVTDAKFSKAVEQMKVKLIAQLQAKADSGKTNEGWEDMMKDVAKTTKDTTTTGKFDKKKVSTGTVYTKKHGPADNDSPVANKANKANKTKKTTKTDQVDEDWNGIKKTARNVIAGTAIAGAALAGAGAHAGGVDISGRPGGFTGDQQTSLNQQVQQMKDAEYAAQKKTPNSAKQLDLGNGFVSTTIDRYGQSNAAVLDTQSNTYIIRNQRTDGGAIVKSPSRFIMFTTDGKEDVDGTPGKETMAALRQAGLTAN